MGQSRNCELKISNPTTIQRGTKGNKAKRNKSYDMSAIIKGLGHYNFGYKTIALAPNIISTMIGTILRKTLN